MELTEYEIYKTIEDLPVVTKVYLPPVGVQRHGVIQLIHGMCEHKERYNKVIDYFTKEGYVCVISDMRGHGENVEFESELGYFGEDGANRLVEDAHCVTVYIKNNFTDLPIIMVAHSMGSLIARAYIKKYDDDIDVLILSGSPSVRKLRSVGALLIEALTVFMDEKGTNKHIHNLVVGDYHKKYANEGVPNSWICSDMSVVEAYNKEPKCGFMFTLNGYHTLCKLQEMVYSKRGWALKNKALEILFVSGADDPCIIDKDTFKASVEHLKKLGYRRVTSILYEDMRHEVFNEPQCDRVFKDMLERMPLG